MNPSPEDPINDRSPYHHSAEGVSPQSSSYDPNARAPLPVDFTHYRPPSQPSHIPLYESPYSENHRKRSFSQANTEEANSQQPPRSNGAIDPSLAALLNPAPGNSTIPSRQKDDRPSNRREELEREAARIREMLTAKEREIAALAER